MAVSMKQLEFYYEICGRKGVTPQDVTNMHGGRIYDLTQELMKLPDKASEQQIETLRNMLADLIDAGVPGIRMPGDKFFRSLNRLSASKWIEDTRAIRNQNTNVLPASENQIERLADMYLFPDVEWESVTKEVTENVENFVVPSDGGESYLAIIETKRQVETVIQRKIYLDEKRGDVQLWRYMTREEFKEELKKLTYQQASNLLDKYTGAYQEWRQNRITSFQTNQIRQIEDRLASIYRPREVTQYHTQNTQDTPFEAEASEDTPFNLPQKRVDNWNPKAYERLPEESLLLFSRDDAEQYIRRLQYELQAKQLYNVGGAQELDYPNHTLEETRTAKNIAEARTKEYRDLNNFLVALESAIGNHFEVDGMSVESLRHGALQVFFDSRVSDNKGHTIGTAGTSDQKKAELRNQIIDFIKLAIESYSVSFNHLMRIADRSDYANELIDEITNDPQYAVILLQLQRKQY